MDAIQSGIKKALEDQRLCDFVASHYYEMSKEQLKAIIVELICATHNYIDGCDIKLFYDEVRDELEDREFFDD